MFHTKQPSTAPLYAALVLLASHLSGCGGTDSAGSPTSAATTASSTAPSSSGGSQSNGGGSQSAPGSVTLKWDPPTENTNGTAATELVGYYIYYGTSPDEMTNWVVAWGGATTSYVFNGLPSGTYYFSVASYNWEGVESAPSGPVSTTI